MFDTVDQMNDYIANEIAEFVRDNMFDLNKHPMDYQDHFDYIVDLYQKYLKKQAEGEL